MKNLIFIISIVIFGLSSCEKATEDITPTNDQPTAYNYQQKPATIGNLPSVGDRITLQFHDPNGLGPGFYSTTIRDATCTYIKGLPNGYIMDVSDVNIFFSFSVTNTSIGVKLDQCNGNGNVSNFFSSDQASGNGSYTTNTSGQYDWKPNGGCSLEGIYDTDDPSCDGVSSFSCPLVAPKLVLFKTTGNIVLFLNW